MAEALLMQLESGEVPKLEWSLKSNALPFSRRERAAQDGFKIATISRAQR
jgi:hypothetical protein